MTFLDITKTQSTATADGKAPAANANVGTKENFLQLLVAQIKNQNPLNPQDGTQFLSQLSQFTEMERMLGMREDLAAIRESLSAKS